MDLNQLQIEELLNINLEAIGNEIELVLGEYIKPCPPGIYVINKLEPVMVDGGIYYVKKNDRYVQVDDVNKETTAIYNKDYHTIITSTFMKNKNKFISNNCLLPYRGIHIALVMIRHYVNSMSQYLSNDPNTVKKLSTHLYSFEEEASVGIPVNIDVIENDLLKKIEEVMMGLYRDIQRFVGKDDWHIYTIRLNDSLVRIEKNMDFRIYDWTESKNKLTEQDDG